MKIKHYTLFYNHVSENINWENLRNNENESAYFIPSSKQEYINDVSIMKYDNLYNPIISYCKLNNIDHIISIGAGRCALEYHLKINSNLNISVTDVTQSILRIHDFKLFDNAFIFNPIESNMSSLKITKNTMLLFCRIDTEFDDEKFKKIFYNAFENDILHICFIPAELLNIKIFLSEFFVRLKSYFSNKKLIFCGYARSKNEFLKIWSTFYKINNKPSNKFVTFLKKMS
jgi:hypothetical protein